LFVVLTVLCAVFAVIGRWQYRQKLLREFRDLGGSILASDPRPFGSSKQYGIRIEGKEHSASDILTLLSISKQLSLRHDTIVLWNTSANDDVLRAVTRTHHIRDIVFCGTEISGDGIEYLREVRDLRSIHIDLTVEDKIELADLAKAGAIDEAYITSTASDVAALRELDNVRSVTLECGDLTEVELEMLVVADNLSAVYAGRCDISEENVASFRARRPDVNLVIDE
jgi:hypothetical protein